LTICNFLVVDESVKGTSEVDYFHENEETPQNWPWFVLWLGHNG